MTRDHDAGPHLDLRLQVVRSPRRNPRNRQPVLRGRSGTVIISGTGPLTCRCGRCDAVLAHGVALEDLDGVLVRCGTCDAYNSIAGISDREVRDMALDADRR